MRLLVALTSTLLLALGGPADAQNLDPLVTGDLRDGIRVLETAAQDAETAEQAAHLRYLIGRAHQQAGDCRTAIAEFDALEDGAEDGALWVSRARFGRSECLARMEQPGPALSAFFEEAERLIDPARRDALASELMEFARDDMTLNEDGAVPNSYRAQQIFGVVLTLSPAGEFSDEAEHHRARLGNDVATLQGRISRDPDGAWACRDRAALAFAAQYTGWGAVPAEAHWYVATECSGTESRRAARALADLEYSARAVHALDAAIPNIDDIDNAQPLRRRLVQQLLQLGDVERAREELDAALETSSGRDLDAVLLLATAFVSTGNFDDARALWTVAESLTSRSSIRDRIAAEWTATRRSESEEARRAADLDGAIAYLGLLEEEVPREQASARELTGRLLAEAGRTDQAISTLLSAETSTAARAAVEVLELDGRMVEALLIRQEFGLGVPTETLEVAALRAFRTSEEPELIVRTTGLNEVELRFHAIDVEDHLRSIGTLAGIGNLDVDLIAPESTRTFELDATTDTAEGAASTYGPVPLGRLEAGVHAVEVVGETQQASALVRVSDLELTVRSVGGDFVVLVVNTRTGRVVRGANIVVTDGTQVVDEGTTDANGLYRGHNTSASLEVLAVGSAGSAWTTVMAGGGDAVSLRDLEPTRRQVRARMDRTEATPGELVRLHVNITDGELPRVLPTETVEVQFRMGGEILDSWNAQITAGVMQTEYWLSDDLPAGTYSLVFLGEVLPLIVGRQAPHIATTRLEQIHRVSPGDDATFRLTNHGVADQPEVGLPIYGDLDDGHERRLLGHTDENGVLEFSAATSRLRRNQTIEAAGRRMSVELTAAPGPLEIRLEEAAPGVPASGTVTWPDTSDATALLRIRRDASMPRTALALARLAPAIGNPSQRLVFADEIQLDAGAGQIEVPGMPAGNYVMTVEAIAPEHQFAVRTHRFVVRQPGEQPRLTGLDGNRVAPVSTHELAVSADSTLPMLATLEGVGVVDAQVLTGGDRWDVAIPAELAGEGAVSLSHVGEAQARVPAHTIPFTVARDLEVGLSTEAELNTVSVVVTDGDGNPVGADVFVSVQPVAFEPISSGGGLFTRTIARLVGSNGASAPWTHRGQTSAIDLDVLAWQEEQLYETMLDAPYELAAAEMERESVTVGRGYGRGAGGLGAIGYGAGAAGPASRSSDAVIVDGRAGFVSTRRAAAAWHRVRTDANGRATVGVNQAALSRGWYTVTARVVESAPVPRTDTRVVLGDAIQSIGTWVDRDSVPDSVPVNGAVGATQVFTRILNPGETLELDTSGASSASIQVSAAGTAEVVRTLLTPDGVTNGDGAFWREQEQVLNVLTSASPDAESRLRRWVASRGAATNTSGVPARFLPTNTLLSRLETLAEDQVAERARTILAVARQTPDSGQAQAALLHLGRSVAARNPDAVGAYALASLLMNDDFDISTLVDSLVTATHEGQIENRTLALEALALSQHETPLDPATLLGAVATSPDARRRASSAEAIGSLLRALVYQQDERLSTNGALSVSASTSGARQIAPGFTESFPLTHNDDRLIITALDRPAAVRVELGTVTDPGRLELSMDAVRHGPWFDGEEILPVDHSEIDVARDATVGRVLIVRGRISGTTNRSVSLSAFVPPGTQYIPGSALGLTEVWTDGRELQLRGTGGREFSFRAQVVGSTLSGAAWEPAVLSSSDGEVLAIYDPGVVTILPASTETPARLAREPVLQDAQDLTQDEQLSLGVALEASRETAPELSDARALQAMELLMPLLQSAALTQNQVQATGAAAFRAALALEDDEAIRGLFGVLESRAPRAPISETELLQVARTFSRANDLEYARRAWSAVLNLRFLAEVGAGEQLVDLGLPSEGLRLVHNLTTAYPDIPSVTESVFNLPQMLVRQAEGQPDTPEGRFTGRRFRRTADRWLSEYLIRYGDEARAPQAALQQLHIASELEEWERLVALGPAFRRMYDESDLADSFDFMTAYGHQRGGDYSNARQGYERIADEMYGERWSSDRERARLALAQIAHAEGDLAAAIELYRSAGNGFPDARAALTVLESAELRVPAVVDAPPGRGLTVPIRVRAVDRVEVWAYAVDLERLFLRENQIRAVENILLSGIPPIIEESFDLPMNFGALAEHEINLPLREAGAYLVLVRSETTLASTLAVVSDLQLDIVEDPGASALHIGVTDRNGAPLEGATVRVAYPGGTPMAGETDLRGLVHHTGFNASAHVLARSGEQYAVYRGGEDSGFDAPSQIYTGWGYNPAPASLIEGQEMRMQEVQESNIDTWEQNVFRNRRSSSNFDLD